MRAGIPTTSFSLVSVFILLQRITWETTGKLLWAPGLLDLHSFLPLGFFSPFRCIFLPLLPYLALCLVQCFHFPC